MKHILMKLGIDHHFSTKRQTIEGIFDLRPQTRAMGPPRGGLWGVKMEKNFFSIFHFFVIGIARSMS